MARQLDVFGDIIGTDALASVLFYKIYCRGGRGVVDRKRVSRLPNDDTEWIDQYFLSENDDSSRHHSI